MLKTKALRETRLPARLRPLSRRHPTNMGPSVADRIMAYPLYQLWYPRPCNNNSSRFGKWMVIQFVPGTAALLDVQTPTTCWKSHASSSRTRRKNFHIFYQLLLGAPEHVKVEVCGLCQRQRRGLSLRQPERCVEEGKSDDDDYHEVDQALNDLAFSSEEKGDMFSVGAILHLGMWLSGIGQVLRMVPRSSLVQQAWMSCLGCLSCSASSTLDSLSCADHQHADEWSRKLIAKQLTVEKATESRDAIAKACTIDVQLAGTEDQSGCCRAG